MCVTGWVAFVCCPSPPPTRVLCSRSFLHKGAFSFWERKYLKLYLTHLTRLAYSLMLSEPSFRVPEYGLNRYMFAWNNKIRFRSVFFLWMASIYRRVSGDIGFISYDWPSTRHEEVDDIPLKAPTYFLYKTVSILVIHKVKWSGVFLTLVSFCQRNWSPMVCQTPCLRGGAFSAPRKSLLTGYTRSVAVWSKLWTIPIFVPSAIA